MEQLLLVLLGFFLGLVPGWWSRKRRLKVHWGALRAEVVLCREKAETYLNDKVMAPLYRLPMKALKTSYPVLLADAALTESEVKELSRLYGLIEDLNRGLENAAELAKRDQVNILKSEFNRNCIKAKKLIPPNRDGDNLYSRGLAIIESHI